MTAGGPRAWPVLGHLPALIADPLGFVTDLGRARGPYAPFRMGPLRYLLVGDPLGIREVMVDRADRYEKGVGYDGMRVVFRTGLLTSDGEAWKERRRLAQAAFRDDRLPRWEEAVDRAVDAAHARWELAREIDVHAATLELALDVVGRAILGFPLAQRAGEVREALGVCLAFAWSYGNELVHLPLSLPTPGRSALRRAMASLARLADEIIDASGPGDYAWSFRDLDRGAQRDEVLTVLAAGHETIATPLTFAVAHLARAPALAAQVGASESFAGSAFCEALRLWPSAWFLERRALVDDVVGGHPVPRGTHVAVAPWALHRDPAVWPDPERFDPGRFPEGAPRREDRARFLPYGAGPRSCVGSRLAALEGRAVLHRTFLRFEVTPLGPPPRPLARLTLHPSPSSRVALTPRRAS